MNELPNFSEILDRCRERAEREGLTAVAWDFSRHGVEIPAECWKLVAPPKPAR